MSSINIQNSNEIFTVIEKTTKSEYIYHRYAYKYYNFTYNPLIGETLIYLQNNPEKKHIIKNSIIYDSDFKMDIKTKEKKSLLTNFLNRV